MERDPRRGRVPCTDGRSGTLAVLPPAGSPGPTPRAVPRPGSGVLLTSVSPLPEARVVAQRAGPDPLEKCFKLSEGPGPCPSSSGGPLDLQQMLTGEGQVGRALAFLQPARQKEESAHGHTSSTLFPETHPQPGLLVPSSLPAMTTAARGPGSVPRPERGVCALLCYRQSRDAPRRRWSLTSSDAAVRTRSLLLNGE